MNLYLEWFVTRRIARTAKRSFSRLIVRIATVAVALSLAVMIITSALVKGFQQTITDKIHGFMGHVLVTALHRPGAATGYEEPPVSMDQPFYPGLTEIEGVAGIQVFARKAGILRNREDIEGIIVRGVGSDFDWDRFGRFLVEGSGWPVSDTGRSDAIVISRSTQRRMGFGPGDDVIVYFIDQSEGGGFRQRARRFTVSGVYNTGLEEYDRLFALADIDHVRRINRWEPGEVGGFEVYLDDPDRLDELAARIDAEIGPFLQAATVRQLEPNLFDWLNLQTQNERIVMTLMMVVAVINMVTSLLILILERTRMIGVLKALGAKSLRIRRIFLLHAAYIVGVGLFWGNLLGIGLCWAQAEFGLITLPEESYYVRVAPIALSVERVLFLDALTLGVCTFCLLLPSFLVSRIDPVRALRFD